MLQGWRARGSKGRRHSDMAVGTALCAAVGVRSGSAPDAGLFGQSQGAGGSDHRSAALVDTVAPGGSAGACRCDLPRLRLDQARSDPVTLAIDATGSKGFGEGEWHMRQLCKGKRHLWRKLHLAGDTSGGDIPAHDLTDSRVGDGLRLSGASGPDRNRA